MIKMTLNPDVNLVKNIKARIKENHGYCPNAIIFNKNTKCICKEFREQIESGVDGECSCGLYRVINL